MIKNSKTLQIIKITISILLFCILGGYLVRQNDVVNNIRQIKAVDYLILVLLVAVSYVPNGIQLRMLLKRSGIKLSWTDTLFLPISMSLWSYIIPANGGFLYSLYFLAKKYQCKLESSSAVGIFTIYMSFILSGVIGLGLSFFLPIKEGVACFLISVFCICFPLVIRLGNFVLTILAEHLLFLGRLSRFISSIVNDCHIWMLDRKIIVCNTMIVLSQMLLSYLIYVWIVHILQAEINLPLLFLVVTVQRLSSLVRLLPGNLGLEEMMTGIFFSMAGLTLDMGLLIAAIARTAQICILPCGMIHSLVNHSVSFRETSGK